ncbi:four helix bundle suffix protein [Geothermobacter ehrlichii]|uniref:Four helix bundle suffix protein n=1 Tax=Geothermobacter ehrlichii TaxID=213224 RepID=A0A5D3WND5_9BACT|nr:four helix bundle suffix domain-containing protein [Geothermobacter ehrlichii]TYO99843.1 four helix bundle suffix protein [Geothermobacter ehrlichii]
MPGLIPQHGGYRKLKSFQVAQLVYDVTVRFCDKYIDRFSRTKDQMVQAARSGVQNIAEGSQVSATSKKTELKLTQVARASLEELKLDYEDFLRQRELPMLEPNHPALMRFKALKPQTLQEVQAWVAAERKRSLDEQGLTRKRNRDPQTVTDRSGGSGAVDVGARPCVSLSSACLAANAALSLLNLACYFLDRQVKRLALDFENEGGFSERLYRVRSEKRRQKS